MRRHTFFLTLCASFFFCLPLLSANADPINKQVAQEDQEGTDWTPPEEAEIKNRLKKLDLSRTIKKQLGNFTIPALQTGNLDAFYASIQSMMAEFNAEQLQAVEEFGLFAAGKSIKSNYIVLKLQSIEQGQRQSRNDFRHEVTKFVIPELIKRVQIHLDDLSLNPVMHNPLTLPATWKKRDRLFWDTHVFKNRLKNARRLADYGYSIAEKAILRAKRDKQTETVEDLKRIEPFPAEVRKNIKALLEREAELRIEYLKESVKTLKEENDFGIRLQAAFAFQLNRENLEETFSIIQPNEFERPSLSKPQLIADVSNLVKTGVKSGKDVLEKTIQLRVGVHWWLRGRYGKATMARGMLKRPKAIQSQLEMFGLYLPEKRTSSAEGDESVEAYAPDFERRHFHTWAVEYRPKQTAAESKLIEAEPQAGLFWADRAICVAVGTETRLLKSGKLKDENNAFSYRLVGSYEYENSLRFLTELVANSSPGQIQEYDRFLQDQPELKFTQGHGLAWMISLARIELAATRSIYGDQTFPFEVDVTDFEKENYLQLLLADAASHMELLKNEPAFQEALQKDRTPDSTTIAYLRRLKLIKDMLISISRAEDDTLINKIAPYQKRLAQYQKELVDSVMQSNEQTFANRIDSPDADHELGNNRVAIDCAAEAKRLKRAGETSKPPASPLTSKPSKIP